jgi:hypothetical protein
MAPPRKTDPTSNPSKPGGRRSTQGSSPAASKKSWKKWFWVFLLGGLALLIGGVLLLRTLQPSLRQLDAWALSQYAPSWGEQVEFYGGEWRGNEFYWDSLQIQFANAQALRLSQVRVEPCWHRLLVGQIRLCTLESADLILQVKSTKPRHGSWVEDWKKLDPKELEPLQDLWILSPKAKLYLGGELWQFKDLEVQLLPTNWKIAWKQIKMPGIPHLSAAQIDIYPQLKNQWKIAGAFPSQWGGAWSGEGILDWTPKEPQVKMDWQLTGLDLQQAGSWIFPHAKISGRGDLRLSLEMNPQKFPSQLKVKANTQIRNLEVSALPLQKSDWVRNFAPGMQQVTLDSLKGVWAWSANKVTWQGVKGQGSKTRLEMEGQCLIQSGLCKNLQTLLWVGLKPRAATGVSPLVMNAARLRGDWPTLKVQVTGNHRQMELANTGELAGRAIGGFLDALF